VLPKGYRGVVVCGTRRAEQWRTAFKASGIEAVVVETDDDELGGACQVGVPARQLLQANAIVTEVTAGNRRLPGRHGWQAVVALLIILALLASVLARQL
jgi:hypothetical protein